VSDKFLQLFEQRLRQMAMASAWSFSNLKDNEIRQYPHIHCSTILLRIHNAVAASTVSVTQLSVDNHSSFAGPVADCNPPASAHHWQESQIRLSAGIHTNNR
jgi:hypothetical protein